MFILFTGIMMMIMTNLHLGTHGLICHQPNKQPCPLILQQTTQNQQEVWNLVKGPLMLICLLMVAMQPLHTNLEVSNLTLQTPSLLRLEPNQQYLSL